jgi:hypothetical protein
MPELKPKQIESAGKRIQLSIKTADRKTWAERAKVMRELYQGIYWPGQSNPSMDPFEREHRVTVNLAQINADIIIASIAYSDPEFQVVPQEPGAVANVGYQKMALTKVWNEINGLHAERRRLKDGVIYGMGVNFVGWRFEEENAEPREGKRPDFLPPEGPLPTLIGADMSLTAPPPEPTVEETLDNVDVVYDNPTIRRVAPFRFFVDPDHDDLDDLRDAKYCLEELLISEQAVKGNRDWHNTSDLHGDSRVVLDDEERQKRGKTNSEEKFIKLYSYWQKEGRRHLIFADGQWDKPLLDEEWPYRFQTYPYTVFVFRVVPDEQLPQGAIEPAETSIRTYNLYRTLQLRHDEKMARAPMGYDTQKLTDKGLSAMKSDTTGAMVECNGNFNEAVGPIIMAPLPQDFYITQNGIKEDGNTAMAVNDYLKGAPDTTRRTLGEVNATVALSAARAQLTQRDYERACEKDANMVLTLLQDERFCDRKRWMVITGESEQEMEGQHWDAETIKGRSDVRVVCNSTRVQTPESLQNTMGFIIQSMAPYVQNGMINPAPFFKKLGQAINLTPQELQEVMKPAQGADQGQQQTQQAMQVVHQALQQIAQQLQATDQKVAELTQELSQGQLDAKTEADLQAKQMDMKHASEKHNADMQMAVEKHQQDMEQSAQDNALKVELARQKIAQDRENAQVANNIKEAQAKDAKRQGNQAGTKAKAKP